MQPTNTDLLVTVIAAGSGSAQGGPGIIGSWSATSRLQNPDVNPGLWLLACVFSWPQVPRSTWLPSQR